MFRFFAINREADYLILKKEDLKHLRVIRATEKVFICSYEGVFYECSLKEDKAKIIKKLTLNNEFNDEVVLAFGIIDFKKIEYLLQKATELGVTKLIPLITENISNKKNALVINKLERWNKIIEGAAKQSFRNVIPTISKATKFKDIIKIKSKNKFLAHEGERYDEKVLKSFPSDSIFLVGPEGGFTEEEVKLAQENGFKIVSLGKRILRAETASLFLLSKIYE